MIKLMLDHPFYTFWFAFVLFAIIKGLWREAGIKELELRYKELTIPIKIKNLEKKL